MHAEKTADDADGVFFCAIRFFCGTFKMYVGGCGETREWCVCARVNNACVREQENGVVWPRAHRAQRVNYLHDLCALRARTRVCVGGQR